MALIALVCGGLYAVGLQAQRVTEHNRLASEASALAKQRMEEMIAIKRSGLAHPACTLLNSDTNMSSRDDVIERRPRIAWHAPSGVLSGTSTSAYAEVHVDVMYMSPLNDRRVTNTYSMIVD